MSTTHYAPIGQTPGPKGRSPNRSSSPSVSTAQMTPDSNSEDDSDINAGEDVGESFEMKSFTKRTGERQGAASMPHHDEGYSRDGSDGDESEDEKHEAQARGRRLSDSTVQSFQLYTPDEERAVAAIAGLPADLRLTSSQYEWLLTSFYITYVLFEWMTLLYRIIPAHIYVSLCVCSWGLLASSQALVTSFPSLLVLRALLGIGEAAFGPGVPFYLSFFFKREELATRTGLFISAAPLATSFASSLAWAIVKLSEKSPIAPWRILFIAEGFPSVVAAIFAWQFIPDRPGSAGFLSGREKRVARLRLRNDKSRKGGDRTGNKLKWREVLQALTDPICYLTALMFFSCNVAFSSMPVFLPTIIREMGFSALSSQGLAAPPYLLSFGIVLLTAYLSDRFRDRSSFLCIHAIVAFVGYSLIAVGGRFGWAVGWRYAGIYLAAPGFFSAITIIITWTINNQDSDSKRGTGMALLNLIGQCGPLLGTRLYPKEDGPYYVKGMSICAGFMLLVFFVSLGLRLYLARENRRRDIIDSTDVEEDREGLVKKKKVDRPRFRYIL